MGLFKKNSSTGSTQSTDSLKSFYIDDNKKLNSAKLIHAYWWDGTINFGDLIGPWLINLITGKPVVNSKYLKVNQTIFTVGSIIEHTKTIPDQKISIWGSGLIKPLDSSRKIRRLRNSQIDNIFALRGDFTKKEMLKAYNLNDNLPLGDPALLLPNFFSPCLEQGVSSVGIVPHHSHMNLFDNYKEHIRIIDVKRYPQDVVADIANLKVCISTSLHGIIIAQAYEIPWVLLRIEDKTLIGDMFKFHDFFSTLEGEDFPIKSVSSSDLHSLNVTELANQAYLPRIKTNLDDLLASFQL